MNSDRAFVNHLLELLEPMDGVSAKAMFGGYGIFCDGLMFGLVADSTLYLKVDKQNVDEFASRGLEPFVYVKGDKPMAMSYREAPADVLDDTESMMHWAQNAYRAALRAKSQK